jgi:ribosomal protein S18 acetylase RimI-like enzyme
VREATEVDLPAIVGIYMRAYAQPPWNERHDPQKSEDYLRWVMSVPGTHCLVSVDADDALGRARGVALAGPRAYERFVEDWERLAVQPPGGWPRVRGPVGYIWEIAVDPDHQRRGHGAALMGAAIETLRGQGVQTLLLRSSERAAPAMALYRRFGFTRLPLREQWDPLAGPWALPLGPTPAE